MNKWSLKFKSNQLENEFQKIQNKNIISFFKQIWIIIFINCTIYLWAAFQLDYSIGFKFQRFIFMLYILVTYFLITRKLPQYAKISIILASILLTFEQNFNDYIELIDRISSKCANWVLILILKGNQEMILYFIVLRILSFIDNTICFTIIGLLKIIFSVLQSGYVLIQPQFIITLIFYLFQTFNSEKQQREFFILSQKEDNFGNFKYQLFFQDYFLKYTSQQPYFIFSYNENQNKFVPRTSGNLEQLQIEIDNLTSEEQLKRILRQFSNDNNETLENTLFKSIQKFITVSFHMKIELKDNIHKQKIKANIQLFQGQNLIVILSFDSFKDIQIEKLKNQLLPLQQQNKFLRLVLKKFIIKNNKSIKNFSKIIECYPISSKKLNQFLLRLKFNIIKFSTQIQNSNFLFVQKLEFENQLKQFYLKNLLKGFQKDLPNLFINIHESKIDQNIRTITNKHQLILIIFNIILLYQHSKRINLQVYKLIEYDCEIYKFQFQGEEAKLIIYEKLMMIEKILGILGPSKMSFQKFGNILQIQFQIFKNLQFFFIKLAESNDRQYLFNFN